MRPLLGCCCAALVVACDGSPARAPSFELGDSPSTEVSESPESVMDRIEGWNEDLSERDRRAKYCKMAESPFVFFRGTNHLFWEIAWSEPRLDALSSSQTQTWLHGDLHAANFGAFDDDDGVVVYDLNDFDETTIGDYQYDLWRMSASIVLIARENANLSTAELDDVLEGFVSSYIASMVAYQVDGSENDVSFSATELNEPLRSFVEDVAARNDRAEALDDWTRIIDGQRELDLDLAELEVVTAAQTAEIAASMPGYGDTLSGGLPFDADYFAIKSVARRLLAGTGSLGTPRYYLLVEGPSSDTDDDRILDVKRQGLPTPLRFADAQARIDYDARFADHAARHATGYKALADDVDDHLGIILLADGSYSVRERSVFKKSFDIGSLAGASYLSAARMWGQILATAHARADIDFDENLVPTSVDDAIATLTAGREDQLASSIVELATGYANRVEIDWLRFVAELAPDDCR